MPILLPQGKQQYSNSAGGPLVGGKLWTYQPGGPVVLKTTHVDAAGTVPNTNPIVLDPRGECVVYWTGNYYVELRAADNSLIWGLDITGGTTVNAGDIPLDQALTYAANSVGFNLGKRKAVFATGVAATDDAAIQAAIDAAPVMGVIDLFGAFASSIAKNLKPELMIRNGGGATITHSNVAVNCFQYVPGGSLGFPGNIVIENINFIGPGAPAGEALGTLTFGNVKAAIFIDANCPAVRLVNLSVRGFYAGAVLRRSYCSTIAGGFYIANRHGVMLFDESHTATFLNTFCDANVLTGASVNYGGSTGENILQAPTFVSGAYQNSAVGIWLERCQGAVGVGTMYFEGNTTYDILVGVDDGFAPGYNRTANFTRFQGVGTSSPCATTVGGFNPCNIAINHSVGCSISGLGFYSGSPTSAPNVIVGGGSDFTELDISFGYRANFLLAPSPDRVVVKRSGNVNNAVNNARAQTWGAHGASTPEARQSYTNIGTASGRNTLLLEAIAANADLCFRADAASGVIRVENSAGAPFFTFECINNVNTANKSIQFPAGAFIGADAVAPTIASATTISPTKLVTFVSGTTPIANITGPAGLLNGSELKLIPTGLWTTTTAGNIALASTAVVNRVLSFTYDGGTNKWYPSY